MRGEPSQYSKSAGRVRGDSCIHFTARHCFDLDSGFVQTMFQILFDLEDYAGTYRETRDAYLKAANELKLATGPYKAARDAYVAATATYTKSLYE